MKVAILGAGFAGLSAAWTLLSTKISQRKIQLTLFDAVGIGAGASGVAAGLMHPFANIHAKLNREGWEGYTASMELMQAASQTLKFAPFEASGILRPALSPVQEKEYYLASQKYPEAIVWKNSDEIEALIPGSMRTSGIWIKNGVTVYTDEYLRGLWQACEFLGAEFEKKTITSLDALDGFDLTLVAMGSSCCSLDELSNLPLSYTKGQILELQWPEDLPPLPMALNGNIYCVMLRDQKRCFVGSTYEKQFTSAKADLAVAKELILPKLAQAYPALANAKILDCHAGIRTSTPQHLPMIKKITPKCYVMTGFGSKGLLYHALYSQKLCNVIDFLQKSI